MAQSTTSQLLYTVESGALGRITNGVTYPGGPANGTFTHPVDIVAASQTLYLDKSAAVLLRVKAQVTSEATITENTVWADSGTWINVDTATVEEFTLTLAGAAFRFELEYVSGSGTANLWVSQLIAADVGGGGALTDGDYGDVTVSGAGTVMTVDNAAITLAKMANLSNSRLIGRNTGGTGVPEAITISQALDFAAATQGNIYYRGAATWTGLAPGTAGQALITGGAGADPSWGTAGLTHPQLMSRISLGF